MRSGVRRKVDDLGRVVIPAGIRRSLGIREGDALEVSVQGDEVVFSKPVDQCVFCRSRGNLRTFRDKALCAPCAAGVGMLDTGAEPVAADHDDKAPQMPPSPWPNTERATPPHPPATTTGSPAVSPQEGGLRVVRNEALSQGERHELPASTTAW